MTKKLILRFFKGGDEHRLICFSDSKKDLLALVESLIDNKIFISLTAIVDDVEDCE